MIPHVYLAPRSHSALVNTRMLNKLTKVSWHISTIPFIWVTKITNFWSQQHNLFFRELKLSSQKRQDVAKEAGGHVRKLLYNACNSNKNLLVSCKNHFQCTKKKSVQ